MLTQVMLTQVMLTQVMRAYSHARSLITQSNIQSVLNSMTKGRFEIKKKITTGV